jgi:putative phosphonate metabolism protein
MEEDAGRYAIYFAPKPGSALARFGAAWLGYDAAAGSKPAQPQLAEITPKRLRAITSEPRQYGFHATLKPPFALAEGTDAGMLDQAMAALARGFPAFAAPRLKLACLSGFWALTLAETSPIMDQLAAVWVGELDRFRAPPSARELTRRRRAGLSPSQDALLARWGYPYVMEEFRFHMTLTARLGAEESVLVSRALAPLVAPYCQTSLAVDAISLFRQDCRAARFRLLRRYTLAG